MEGFDAWENPERPPVDAIDCGGVWVSWDSAFNQPGEPLIWHWCSMENRRGDEHPIKPYWAASGVGKHTLVSRDPLHLEPSIYWPDCCGLHGFLRNGHWETA